MEVLEPSESLIASLWQHWHNSCTLAAEPTPNLGLSLIDLNVDAIYAIVVHGIIHAVKYGGIQQWVSEWRYVVNDVRRVVRSLERHPVRITNPKLVERFRAAGHGFHVSMENASVLNAVLKLLGAAFWIPESYSRREDNENPFKSLVSNCQDQVRRYLPLRAPAGAGSCIHALGDTPTLAPTECSPGVFYVKTTHPAASLIPFLIDVIHSSGFSSEAIRILLDPPTISDSLLGIAGPHPALLPPLLRVVPEVLKYRGRWGPEKVRLRFLQWLKSFPEDHTQEVAALVQPIKEWAESTKGEARESYCQHRYEEICDLLELDPGSLEEEEDWDECSDTDNSGVEYWCL
ncbi:hypothetical protein V5O48_005730 [Marasmius crinis-equi]|uniref:Uncharacterized protein n=1 Tax=Marasmius crinis-equi TaxID=585013 RepID=A0ABR3FM63_9AGAR